MSFSLNLYNTSSDPRRVNKDLQLIASDIPINPTDNIDILYPTLIINYSDLYLSANYCYCTQLARFYYITNISLEVGRRIAYECKIDVLQTYSSSIQNCTATIIRNGGIGHPTEIPDEMLPIKPDQKRITSIPFPESPFVQPESYNYLVKVLNGGD